MTPYHKIDSVYKRDEKGRFILGEWSQREFEFLQDVPWDWTEKVDGTNIRIMWDGNKVQFGGRTDNAQIPTPLLTNLSDHFHGQWKSANEMFTEIFGIEENVCLYGEGYGAGIQKGGGNYRDTQFFILFDVKIGNFWLNRDSVLDIADKLGLEVVPIIFNDYSLREAIEYVQNPGHTDEGLYIPSRLSDNAHMEGIVGTPSVPLFNRKGERIITKLKFKDFD